MSDGGRLVVSWDEFMTEKRPSVPSLWGTAESPLIVKASGYTLIGGDTGVGKTLLMSNLILASAAGWKEFLGLPLPGEPVTTLILEAEGNRHSFRDRIRQSADNLGISGSLPIYFHAMSTELTIDGPNLEAMIAETKAKHVFLDTIGRFWSGNENDSTEWRAGVSGPLLRLTTAYDCATTFGDHYSRPHESKTGAHRIRGSLAKLQDGTIMRLEFGRGGQSSRILHIDRVKDGAIPDPPYLAVTVDLKAGTVARDESQDGNLLPKYGDSRLDDFRKLLQPDNDYKRKDLEAILKDKLDLERSRAGDLIRAAQSKGMLEQRFNRGPFRLKAGVCPILSDSKESSDNIGQLCPSPISAESDNFGQHRTRTD